MLELLFYKEYFTDRLFLLTKVSELLKTLLNERHEYGYFMYVCMSVLKRRSKLSET